MTSVYVNMSPQQYICTLQTVTFQLKIQHWNPSKELVYFSCIAILLCLLYLCVTPQFITNNKNRCFTGMTQYNNRLWVECLGFNPTKHRVFSLYCCVHLHCRPHKTFYLVGATVLSWN